MAKGIPPTVGNFFVVLTSLLTQYDAAQETRARKSKYGHHNIYALSHYFEAVNKAEEELKRTIGRFKDPEVTMTPEIAGHLIEILAGCFTVNHRSNEFDLPPLRKFYKQLDAFVTSGKRPSLIG